MTKTKPMTDEWKDSLLRYCDVFDTKDGSYLNEHNVINFIEELLHQATSKAREEENKFYPIAKAIPCPVCGFQVVFENKSLKKDK